MMEYLIPMGGILFFGFILAWLIVKIMENNR